MDKSALLATLFFVFMIGMGIGFYAARVLF
jgi:hypothetical protein